MTGTSDRACKSLPFCHTNHLSSCSESLDVPVTLGARMIRLLDMRLMSQTDGRLSVIMDGEQKGGFVVS